MFLLNMAFIRSSALENIDIFIQFTSEIKAVFNKKKKKDFFIIYNYFNKERQLYINASSVLWQ